MLFSSSVTRLMLSLYALVMALPGLRECFNLLFRKDLQDIPWFVYILQLECFSLKQHFLGITLISASSMKMTVAVTIVQFHKLWSTVHFLAHVQSSCSKTSVCRWERARAVIAVVAGIAYFCYWITLAVSFTFRFWFT